MNTKTLKIKLSINCPKNVETYVLIKKDIFPSGFFLKILEIAQFNKLFIKAEHKNATVLLRRINQVPPNKVFKAV